MAGSAVFTLGRCQCFMVLFAFTIHTKEWAHQSAPVICGALLAGLSTI